MRQLVESLTVPTKLQFDDGIVDIEIVNSINENFKVKFNFKLLEMDEPSVSLINICHIRVIIIKSFSFLQK